MVVLVIVSGVAVYGTVSEWCATAQAPEDGKVDGGGIAPDRVLEFPGAAGSKPDPRIWNHDIGGHGWGNGELQYYTDRRENSSVDGNGNLVITARRDEFRPPNGERSAYTSARLTTKGKLEVKPGSYVEAVIDPPVAEGVWPAFWLLGSNIDDVGWPASGELDVMEIYGNRTSVSQFVHTSTLSDPKKDNPFGGRADGGLTELESVGSPHRYGVFFDGSEVRFYVDRRQTLRLTADDARASGRAWPFDQSFFLLVNVAIGGLSGDPSDTDLPRTMTVGPISIWTGGTPFEEPTC